MNGVPSNFLPGTKLQYAWDSVSLGALKDCARKYQYSIIEGWRSKVIGIDLHFGLAYHHGLELYDRKICEGLSHDEATLFVVRDALLTTSDWPKEEDSNKNRSTLLRSLIWYLEEFKDDNAKTVTLANGKPAVELSFTVPLDFGNSDQPYVLCGHIDRLVSFTGDTFVMDRKAQPITSKVLGIDGWIEIGKLKIGDLVAGRSGKFIPVKGMYPKGITKVYRVSFNDRTSALCGEDHLWTVATQVDQRWKVKSLHDLLYRAETTKYHVPLVRPIQHPERNLPIHPYLLGVLLGDGYLDGNSIQLSSNSQEMIDKVRSILPEDSEIHKASQYNYAWTIRGKIGYPRGNTVLEAIKSLDLKGKLSAEKFVPQQYMFASEQQRRDLLQGLLDTDGTSDNGHILYDSRSLTLIKDVCALVRSLGGNARFRGRIDAKDSLAMYRANLRMTEWQSGIGKRYIASVDRVEDAETVCIEVDADDGLYVTENHIVTHNTTKTTISPSYFSNYDPDNQMTLYSLAGQIIWNAPVKGVIIDAAQIAVGFTKFERGITWRTTGQLDEWLKDLKYWLGQAEEYAAADYYPMNDRACRMCSFKKICSKDPAVRDTFLASDFERRTWNPLQRRG